MASLNRLSKAELRNKEGSFSFTVHQPDPELFGRAKLLLLLGWILSYNQIAIHSNNQEKTLFTCLFGVFSYRRMLFILCNAPATFQHCMTALFSKFLRDSIEVFMDYFFIFRNNFNSCLAYLTKILKVYVKKQLALSWEKSHFMLREGVVLGHLVLGKGLEVNKS